MLMKEINDRRISEDRKEIIVDKVEAIVDGTLDYAESADLDISLTNNETKTIQVDENASTIVQVSRVGSNLTMDMTCYTV